jgi:hypothetical protein
MITCCFSKLAYDLMFGFLLTFCMFLSASDLWVLSLCLTFKIMLVLLCIRFDSFFFFCFSLLLRPEAENVCVMS